MEKQCARCKETKTADAFTKSKYTKSGLGSYCSACNNERSRNAVVQHKPAADPKRCHRCHVRKPLVDFARNATKADGYASACKICDAARLHAYTQQPHVRKQRTERHNKKARFYAQNRVRRISGREVEGFTDAQWVALRDWFGGVCLACGSSEQIAADHVIPITLGGLDHITNIQPLCRRCNSAKGGKIVDHRDLARLADFLRTLLVK